MKNTINFKQLSIALILILLPLIFYAQPQGGEGGDPDQETPRMTEYSELDTVPEIIDCFPLVSIRKMIYMNTALGRRVLSIDFSDRNAGLALYLVRIEDGRNSLIKKIVR